MTSLSYADEQREKNPVQYEKSRLVIDVSTALKLALEDQGCTISDLAHRIGRGRAIVSRQLSGQENMTLGKLAELAFHLGKRFEVGLVDIAEPMVRHARWYPFLVSSQAPARRGGAMRVSVMEPNEKQISEPAQLTTAA